MIQEIGLHKVRHGDVMNKDFSLLLNGEKASIIYTDPPWGQGNLKYWQTINQRHTGADKKDIDYNEFISRIFQIGTDYLAEGGVFFVEYGINWREDIVNMGRKVGLSHLSRIDLRYKSGSKLLPLDLHIFSNKTLKIPKSYVANLKGTHGYNSLKKAIPYFAKEGKILLDPCCGMGFSAKAALENRMYFRGNELNSKRLEKTIKRLNK